MKFISLSEILDSLIETVRGEVDGDCDYSYSYLSHQNFDINSNRKIIISTPEKNIIEQTKL